MKRKILIAVLGGGLLLSGVGMYLAPLLVSLPDNLSAAPEQGVVFTDRKGRPMRRLLADGLRLDEPAIYGEFPDSLILATLAAEDSRFFSHNGIDFISIGRAVKDSASRGRFVSGASTVSQQTIKLASPPRARNFKTKIVESLAARKLEIFHDKEEILTAYLNRLPYGNQFTGTRAAARGYFGKPLGDLSLAESALLAGLPNKPSTLNPWRNFEGARKRQFWVLGRMKEEGWITEAEFASAMIESIRLLPKNSGAFHAPHFVDLVLQKQEGKIPERGIVETTLDLELQQAVEASIAVELAGLSRSVREESDLQAAVVVIENATGEVLALSGSRSYFGTRSGQVNGAWAGRSAGSTLKPFTYLLAMDRGYTAGSVLADTPIEYVTSTGAYQPVNFDRRFHGPVTLRHALANSMNVPAVKVLNRIGGPGVLHELMQRDLKFSSLKSDPVEYGLGLTLGNSEVRLLELTNAYACLARLGEYQPYRMVKGSGEGSIDSQTLFNRQNSWIIADILSDNGARAEAFGLNSALRLPFKVAAKTGTSTDFRDNWTVGYTPEFTVGVWLGRFSNRPLQKVSGASGAGPIFKRVMEHLYREGKPTWYDRPANMVEVEIDSLNGKRIPDGLEKPQGGTVKEWFEKGSEPAFAEESDYSPGGRTILPIEFATWWGSPANHLKKRAGLQALSEDSSHRNFRIVSPLDGTVAFLDPDLPEGGRKFPLEIAGHGGEQIEWNSESLSVETKSGHSWVILKPGEHEVFAFDKRTGKKVTTKLLVKVL